MKVYKNLHYFPLVVFFLFPCTFAITYCLAVYWDHVSPILPYISETGALDPERCIFTQMLNIGALLLGICAYIRYRQVEAFMKVYPKHRLLTILNTASAVFGLLISLGMDMAANFQESRGSTCHYIGASIGFSAGALYFGSQTVLTSSMVPYACSKCMMYFRAVMAAMSFFFSFGTIIPGLIAKKHFIGDNPKKWGPEDGGYEWHIVSVTSEWVLSLANMFYILSLLPEFRNIRIYAPDIELINIRSQVNQERNHQGPVTVA